MLSRHLLRDLFNYRETPRPRRGRKRSRSSARPFAGKRFRPRRTVYCANRGVHPGGFRIHGKPYYWGGHPLCRRCHRFFTASSIKKLA